MGQVHESSPESAEPVDAGGPDPESHDETGMTVWSHDGLIAHATNCWQAARENAERLVRRRAQLLSVIAAILALGLYRVEWTIAPDQVSPIESRLMLNFIKGGLVLGLGLLVAAAATMLGVRLGREEPSHDAAYPFAAHRLTLPNEILLGRQHAASVRKLVYSQVMSATLDLQGRNVRINSQLRNGEQYFVMALLVLAVTITSYLIASGTPTQRDAGIINTVGTVQNDNEESITDKRENGADRVESGWPNDYATQKRGSTVDPLLHDAEQGPSP